MIRAFLHYLFPYIPLRNRMPLLPRHYSSEHARTAAELDEAIHLIKGYGLARTDQDAQRVLQRYPGHSLITIFKIEKRRRQRNKIKRAVKRLKRLFSQ